MSGWLTMLDRVAAARYDRHSSTVGGVAGAHWSSMLLGYGTPFSLVFLPTELAGCKELTKGVFNRWGALEQDARQQGSSFNLQ
jgi:hypothetical protein